MKIILPLIFLICTINVEGQTWTGNRDNNWHNDGNWNTGKIPSANSTVIIGSVPSKRYPVITKDVRVRNIYLSDYNTGELTVTNLATLTVMESFYIYNHGKLTLDNGTLQFMGNGSGSMKINMSWTNTVIEIKNKGVLNSPFAQLNIVGEIHVEDGTMNLGNGLNIYTNKLLRVTEGDINVYGNTDIQGVIDGGTGKFIFDGKSYHNMNIHSGGTFYMSPAAPGFQTLACEEDIPETPELSGGSIEFRTSSEIRNSGYFYGGNAQVIFHKSTSLHGTAIVETHNGSLYFHENLTAHSASVNITCKGTLRVDGNTTFQSAAYLNAGNGKVYLKGNLRTERSSAEINAGNSTIYFSGSTFENEGYYNAGTSTFIFNGSGTQTISTFSWRDNITFYNLTTEGTAEVTSTHHIMVLNDMEVSDAGEFNIYPGMTLDVVWQVLGDQFIHTNRPYIVSIRINSPNSITAVFNEPLNRSSVQNAYNYRIENEAGQTINSPSNPQLGGAGNNELTLTLGFNITENEKYYLISNNIKNLRGYTSNYNHIKGIGLTEPINTWRWAGRIDSDWDKKDNWIKNLLPATESSVIIPVTPNNPVISSTGNRISELKIETGATLTIGSTGNLTVDNGIENQAGTGGLIIASDITGTGSLLHDINSVPATFQRYISGEPQGWQMISSPVTDQAISGNFTPTGGDNPYGDGTRYDFYAWYEPDTSWVYLLNDIQQPTWKTANGNNTFIQGRGYLVSYKDAHPTKYFEGNLNNGQVSVALTSSTGTSPEFGQNLIGNPYPSSIDWKAAAGWNRDKLATSGGGYDIWIWSETHQNYGAYNSSSASDKGTLGVGRYIAPNQGFFVKARGTGTISMDNRVRSHQESGNWLKSGNVSHSNEKINITIESEAGSGRDEILVEFGHPETETGTHKKFSFIPTAPALYIPHKGASYSILLAGEKESSAVMPLSFKPGTAGNFKLTVEVPEGAFDFLELYDRQTGERHNLLEKPTFSFQAGAKDRTDRFMVQVLPGHYADPHNSLAVEVFASQQTLQVDMRLVTGEYTCKLYDLTGKLLAVEVLQGGDIAQVKIPVPASVVIVGISGREGNMYKKVPVH